MDGKFRKLRFSEFSKAATAGAIIGAAALAPTAAKANTGSIELDQAGARWFVNTNITFSTTSSGFGFSEASLITASTTRGDAYDGALSWHVWVGTPGDEDSLANVYRSPGGVVSSTANSVLGTVQSIQGLNVQGQIWVSTSKAVARSIIILQNPTGSDITAIVDNDSNLGSDSNTFIQATSSGDATFDPSDNWWVSCQRGSLDPTTCDGTPGTPNADNGTDPINTFAFQGQGGAVRGTDNSPEGGFQNGNDNPFERFSNVVVPAGQTRALMYLVQLSDTPAHAIADAAAFNSGASVVAAGYMADLPPGVQLNQIVNWSIGTGVPTLGEWGLGGMAALLGLTGLGSLGVFGRRRSA